MVTISTIVGNNQLNHFCNTCLKPVMLAVVHEYYTMDKIKKNCKYWDSYSKEDALQYQVLVIKTLQFKATKTFWKYEFNSHVKQLKLVSTNI